MEHVKDSEDKKADAKSISHIIVKKSTEIQDNETILRNLAEYRA